MDLDFSCCKRSLLVTLLSSISDIPVWAAPSSSQSLTLRLRLITPMFGGGVTPGTVDIANPIRSASVRGQLRFWWRATAGSQFSSSTALYKAEAALWGGMEAAGKVITRAALEPTSRQWLLKEAAKSPNAREPNSCLLQCAVYKPNGANTGLPLYALQAFVGGRGKDRNTPDTEPSFGLINVEFDLHLTFPEIHREEILNAVAAWIRYGGLGARTRRGCGSLQFITSQS